MLILTHQHLHPKDHPDEHGEADAGVSDAHPDTYHPLTRKTILMSISEAHTSISDAHPDTHQHLHPWDYPDEHGEADAGTSDASPEKPS